MNNKMYLGVIAIFLTLVFMLSACTSSKTLETYEENLGSDYNITKFYGEDLEEAFTDDMRKYEHEGSLTAIREDFAVLVIHQFGSVKDAKKYIDDNQGVDMFVVRDGKFVLLSSHKEVINEALGK